jgi:aspartate kinase
MGELFSTTLLGHFLKQNKLPYEWVDVRDIIRTDDTFKDPQVDWNYSQQQAIDKLGTKLKSGSSIITQGFIGSTSDNASVTLGREGSDYTAALLAAWLQASSVTIWKDVEGLQMQIQKSFQIR